MYSLACPCHALPFSALWKLLFAYGGLIGNLEWNYYPKNGSLFSLIGFLYLSVCAFALFYGSGWLGSFI